MKLFTLPKTGRIASKSERVETLFHQAKNSGEPVEINPDQIPTLHVVSSQLLLSFPLSSHHSMQQHLVGLRVFEGEIYYVEGAANERFLHYVGNQDKLLLINYQ